MNPEEAALYLNAAAVEDSEEMLLVALRDIAEAKQMAHVAEHAGVAREALYRMLSKSGNSTYSSLRGVLAALGIRVRFATVESLGSSLRVDSTNTPNAIGASRPAEMQAAAKKRVSHLESRLCPLVGCTQELVLLRVACLSNARGTYIWLQKKTRSLKKSSQRLILAKLSWWSQKMGCSRLIRIL